MIPLFTSVPPNFSRLQPDGRDLGNEYAVKCIRSWRASGFEPVTVNSSNEILADVINAENIACIAVRRDASQQFGRPLIFLGDFISAACSYNMSGPVVITNADILLDMSDSIYQKIKNMQPGQCFVAKRYDIETMDSRKGIEYGLGYDFFAFHSEDLKNFACDDFVMGLPWWDHYLPVWMYLRGLQQLPIHEKFIFHLHHTERWDFEKWVTLGGSFLKKVGAVSDNGMDFPGPFRSYVDMVASEIKKQKNGLKGHTKAALQELTRSGRLEKKIQILHKVANANVKWLDSMRESTSLVSTK